MHELQAIWGIFTARLEAVPFHGGLNSIYETASRLVLRRWQGPASLVDGGLEDS